jgi:cystathionine beta-lyase family protein involved in aluminum resistance
MVFSDKVLSLVEEGERELADIFRKIDNTSFYNTQKIMEIFAEHRVSTAHFDGTSGYGYDDKGRDTLDCIWADVMGAEAAFVRHSIANGTHALTIGLFGLLRPGDILLSVAGKPYDTLGEVIGIAGEAGNGSLADFGVDYRQIDLKDQKTLDLDAITALEKLESLADFNIEVILPNLQTKSDLFEFGALRILLSARLFLHLLVLVFAPVDDFYYRRVGVRGDFH